MNKAEISRVWKRAQEPFEGDLLDIARPLFGIGLPDYGKREVTLDAAAAHIRWQGMYILSGEWNQEEVSNCFTYLRRKAILID